MKLEIFCETGRIKRFDPKNIKNRRGIFSHQTILSPEMQYIKFDEATFWK